MDRREDGWRWGIASRRQTMESRERATTSAGEMGGMPGRKASEDTELRGRSLRNEVKAAFFSWRGDLLGWLFVMRDDRTERETVTLCSSFGSGHSHGRLRISTRWIPISLYKTMAFWNLGHASWNATNSGERGPRMPECREKEAWAM